MKNLRLFGTSATIITFALIALSGVGLFFGIRAGFIKTAHQWIGLAMVIATLVHIVANWRGFLGYFKGAKTAAIILPVVIVLGAWVYSTTMPKDGAATWKKGLAYEKLVMMDVNTAMDALGGNKAGFAEFLASKGINAPTNISIKDFAKANKLKEHELLNAMLK